MKNKLKTIICISIVFIFISGCTKNNINEKRKIIGTWIGAEYPDIDTAIFYKNNTVKFIGRAGNDRLFDFEIKEGYITLDGLSPNHQYVFSENNRQVYIGNLMISNGMNDNGIDFIKE